MLLCKFKIFFFFSLLFSFKLLASIDGNLCLQSNFSSQVSHKGFPFGMTQNVLKLSKNNCEIILEHKKLKFIKNKWLVDICRTPIHIKSGRGAVEVIRKTVSCSSDSRSREDEFCKTLGLIEKTIQNDGLIFAKGEKETLSTEHGKIYCSYLLLRSYLRYNKVLSRSAKQLGFDLEKPGKVMIGREATIKEGSQKVKLKPFKEASPRPMNEGLDIAVPPSYFEKPLDLNHNDSREEETGSF